MGRGTGGGGVGRYPSSLKLVIYILHLRTFASSPIDYPLFGNAGARVEAQIWGVVTH